MQTCPYTPILTSSNNSSSPQPTKHSPWLFKDSLLFPNWSTTIVGLLLMSNVICNSYIQTFNGVSSTCIWFEVWW